MHRHITQAQGGTVGSGHLSTGLALQLSHEGSHLAEEVLCSWALEGAPAAAARPVAVYQRVVQVQHQRPHMPAHVRGMPPQHVHMQTTLSNGPFLWISSARTCLRMHTARSSPHADAREQPLLCPLHRPAPAALFIHACTCRQHACACGHAAPMSCSNAILEMR